MSIKFHCLSAAFATLSVNIIMRQWVYQFSLACNRIRQENAEVTAQGSAVQFSRFAGPQFLASIDCAK